MANSLRSVRTMTTKAAEAFNGRKDEYIKRLNQIECDIRRFISEHVQVENQADIEFTESECCRLLERYKTVHEDFCQYIKLSKTEESDSVFQSQCSYYESLSESVFQFIKGLKAPTEVALSVKSRTSIGTGSRKSRSSNLSEKLILTQAKVQAAKARLKFSEQELTLKKQRAQILEKETIHAANFARQRVDLDLDIQMLKEQKELAAIKAEVETLEASSARNSDIAESLKSIPKVDPQQRTKAYVNSHSTDHSVHEAIFSSVKEGAHGRVSEDIHGCGREGRRVMGLSFPEGPEIKQSVITADNRKDDDFMRFLLKKDLLLSRLTNFSDKPENFLMWKTSFRSIMEELCVNPFEELDLLVKWLGPESSKYAQTIRAAYSSQPERGLQCVWERLEERFGCPEMLEQAIKKKIYSFPHLEPKDSKKLYDLADLASEIEALKTDNQYSQLLSYYDTSSGVIPIVKKLPANLREKWVTRAAKYKQMHNVPFPPFSVFASFLREISKIRNDPGLYSDNLEYLKGDASKNKRHVVSARKTGVSEQSGKKCPIHGTSHTLNECRVFKRKRFDERKRYLKQQGICFRCCESSDHKSKECKVSVKCSECGSESHPTALHIRSIYDSSNSYQEAPLSHGGEYPPMKTNSEPVASKCTQICGTKFSGKSCAKIVFVRVYHKDSPHKSLNAYAIIDDQSNRSLARSDLFDELGLKCDEVEFTLSSCNGHTAQSGRVADGLVIESIDKKKKFDLPTLLECDKIPNTRDEIPTPNVALHHPHLAGIARHIPPIDDNAEIMLLIGRDLIEVHYIQDQRIGKPNTPYAQQIGLGWVIIGETCLGKIHQTTDVNVNKTYLHSDGRNSVFKPCENKISIENQFDSLRQSDIDVTKMYDHVFDRTDHDEKLGLSIDDKDFLSIMRDGFIKNKTGHWEAPLPFRTDRNPLPNNRPCAEKPAAMLHKNLSKDVAKRNLFVAFMDNIFRNGHAEKAPDLDPDQQCWYLPVFGVFHPQKQNQIRCVFDSSAKYEGVSLNDVLLAGPDLTNNLTGLLMRFRKEQYAVMADLQQMLYSFQVREDHRDFLRFLWYEDNDPTKPMIEYRMCVHVFGNSPSPAIATYGLRKSVQNADPDVRDFVTNDFYVDDGLISKPSVSEAISLVKRTQSVLKDHRLRLHKISSNSEEIMLSFPSEDLAKEFKDLDIRCEDLPCQRSLGLKWDLQMDSFMFDVVQPSKPNTRRGVLAVVNSIYDPLGFLGPVIINGRLILRDLLTCTSEWDEPLPDKLLPVWDAWRSSLNYLKEVSIPRQYLPSFSGGREQRVFMYSDASERAISAVGYLVSDPPDNEISPSFLMGKCKVAPLKGHTVPRLELCAAVLSVELADVISEQLGIPLELFKFHCDSKVVLGYINNKSRRFHTYVCNRVSRLLRSTKACQWVYVLSSSNPADCGTRGIHAKDIQNSMWLKGPPNLKDSSSKKDESFPLIEPDTDKEIKHEIKTLKTSSLAILGTERFSRFSSWRRIVESMARLKHIARCFHVKGNCTGWHTNCDLKTVSIFDETEKFIIRTTQEEVYRDEIDRIRAKRSLMKGSPLYKLDPYLDSDGVLRVGGRLRKSNLTSNEKNPIIIPGKHHLAKLLVQYHHEAVKHQGRHFTEGAVRSAGLWITGGRRLISSIIFKCITCRKLRGKLECQKMADLPETRLLETSPFTYVGVDTFGPWHIVTRRTRGGQANSKRWAILFTCLCIRAIHIEVVEEMSSSAFINALRRFVSIRGKVKELHSDRGTNFVGACDELNMPAIRVEQGDVKDYLYRNGCVWKFNTPHSSHFGGSWERMIGMTRRILDSTLSSVKNLTHDILITLMAEACAIVNSRPLVPVSSDWETPEILSPSSILTFKGNECSVELAMLDLKDLYRKQWKQVKHLADSFWNRWRKEYLQSLQQRCKWVNDKPNICNGDVVLLRDKSVGRNDWPMGRITQVFASDDGKVRKVKVSIAKDGSLHEYIRPIGEIVVLISKDQTSGC